MPSLTEDTIRSHGITYPLLSDSGVYQNREGYERILIVTGWHHAQLARMAEFHIRVDRVPGFSFANTSVWTQQSGWQAVAHMDHREFWDDMPGYLRWSNDSSDSKTAALASDMIGLLVTMIDEGDIVI